MRTVRQWWVWRWVYVGSVSANEPDAWRRVQVLVRSDE